ncbi:MAG: hypothetical protein QOH92_1038 [Chloroflexota bacterium]|nr:hypothetical protein [Chloroflexota bacterium]
MQTDAFVLGVIAWGSLALFLVGALVGTLFLERAYRLALVIFAVATVGGFTFSFLSGFSIGRFTALLPLVVTAFAVTRDRNPRLQLAAQAAAIGIYIVLAWIIAAQVGYWGIQIELPLCLVAYAAALIFPPPRKAARA